jgi:PKD repeat protein
MTAALIMRPGAFAVSALVALTALSGCSGAYESDFPVVVVNKTVNTLQVLANGGAMGDVPAGQTGSFSLSLPESNPNVFSNGVAPTPQAHVTFAAKDLRTGALSDEKSMTLSKSSPTYITFSIEDFPSAIPTVARFTFSPVNAGINQDIIFNAASSSVSNGTYAWDFGDGQTGTGVSITHQYPRAAMYTVVLTVTNDRGQSSTASRTVNVSAALPPQAANFTFSPTAPAINQDVLFTASGAAAVPGGTFSWDFGDGGTGSGATTTHRYVRASTYTVTLRVSNGVGQTATTSRTISVSGTLPGGAVSFTFSPTTPGVDDTVFFNAAATTVVNATFSWDFGDGSNGSGVTTTHKYARAGTYSATMTVRNDLGQTASTSRSITVAASSTQLVANFIFSPTDPTISLGTNSVLFDATDSSSNVTAWAWDFGDGSTGSGQKTSHSFSRAGTWVVRLTVSDSTGRTSTVTKNVTVLAAPPPPPSS